MKHISPYTLLFLREFCHPPLTGAASGVFRSSPLWERASASNPANWTDICVLPGCINTWDGRHTGQRPHSSNDYMWQTLFGNGVGSFAGRGFVVILPFGEAVVHSGALRGVSVWMETKVRAHILTPHQFLHFISPTQNLSVKPTQTASRTRKEGGLRCIKLSDYTDKTLFRLVFPAGQPGGGTIHFSGCSALS